MQIFGKIARVLWNPHYRAAFLRARVAASTEHDDIIAGLGLDIVVDIGANRGQFALCVRRHYPQAQIISFEPLRKPAATWRKVFAGDTRAQLFNKAIAPAAGSAAMHVARWDVSSSLLPIGQGQQENFPFTDEARQEQVELAPLSACIARDSLAGTCMLKMDVQGFELTALQGCEDLLGHFRYVYVESSFVELYVGQALADDVISFLQDRGFTLACVANLELGRSRRPIQADFLFSRRAGSNQRP
jgi:FkbM family methyltransferase